MHLCWASSLDELVSGVVTLYQLRELNQRVLDALLGLGQLLFEEIVLQLDQLSCLIVHTVLQLIYVQIKGSHFGPIVLNLVGWRLNLCGLKLLVFVRVLALLAA